MVTRRDPAPVRRPAEVEPPGGDAGYTLVILLVIVTTLNVLVAAALPAWSAMDRREKEEELIFRGLQYAEGIRVFQTRFGRLPVRLEELVEVEPRSMRQLWTDPFTGKSEWGLVFANAAGGGAQNQNQNPILNQRGNSGNQGAGGLTVQGATGGNRDRVTTGPIVGVYSLAEGDGIKTFFGKQKYSEWRFTVDLLVQGLGGGGPQGGGAPGQPNQANPPTDRNGRPLPNQPTRPGQGGVAVPGLGGPQIVAGRLPDLSARWIGRPWPPEIQAQINPGTGAGGQPALPQGNAPGSAFGQPQSGNQGSGQPRR